jgi:CheY-like chemotaxis protein
MEAVGQLTGGLAHDFNNMLTVVIGNLDALGRALKDSGRTADRVQMALTGAMSCAELTRRLLAFARRQPLQPTAIDFGALISNVAKLLERTLGEKIKIELQLAKNLWQGLADSAQVESALMNLAVNARDAMPEGGKLTITAENATLDQNREPYEARGEFVMLSVSDTGCGMPPEVVERVFEPFFTTKQTGHGTGLGLSMVYGFVKQSGGYIKIESEVGKGTAVRIYLPKAKKSAATRERVSHAVAPVTAIGLGRRLLLVEDDAGVRAVTAAFLKELQFTIMEADSGASALQILQQSPDSIDLLFSDVVMPGELSGIALAAAARKLRPDLRILLTSGYTESFHEGGEHNELLPKPYREADLLAKLQQFFPE